MSVHQTSFFCWKACFSVLQKPSASCLTDAISLFEKCNRHSDNNICTSSVEPCCCNVWTNISKDHFSSFRKTGLKLGTLVWYRLHSPQPPPGLSLDFFLVLWISVCDAAKLVRGGKYQFIYDSCFSRPFQLFLFPFSSYFFPSDFYGITTTPLLHPGNKAGSPFFHCTVPLERTKPIKSQLNYSCWVSPTAEFCAMGLWKWKRGDWG